MSPALRTAREEEDLMKELLGGTHASNDKSSLADKSEAIRRPASTHTFKAQDVALPSIEETLQLPRTPKKKRQAEDEDIAQLLEGAEDWDWNDMFSPQRIKSPKKPKSPSKPVRLCHSLCCLL